MAERRDRPSEAEVERWAIEDGDSWGDLTLADVRVVYPNKVDSNDVAAVRRATAMSAEAFASVVGISVATLRRRERGQGEAQGPKALLKVIARESKAVLPALVD